MTRTSGIEIVVINDNATFNGGGSNVALQSAIGTGRTWASSHFF